MRLLFLVNAEYEEGGLRILLRKLHVLPPKRVVELGREYNRQYEKNSTNAHNLGTRRGNRPQCSLSKKWSNIYLRILNIYSALSSPEFENQSMAHNDLKASEVWVL